MISIVVVHYSELGTKGNNRRMFENKLAEDIRGRLAPRHAGKVRVESARVIVELAAGHDPREVRAGLDQVSGVAWYAFGQLFPWSPAAPGEDLIEAAALDQVRAHPEAKTFKIFARRSAKTYPLTSGDICRQLGTFIVDKTGLAVNLDDHDLAIHVEVLAKEICVFSSRTEGLRGLPRGSSGSMLCLFSGGIDSPVAAWLMMCRGATVHLLHFHPFRTAEDVRESKIFALHRVLRGTDPTSKLYLVPFDRYQVAAALRVPTEYETVFFRRFMFRAAEELARAEGLKAIVTGDSLGQVASQTLENLTAAQTELSVPVFQPVIAYDKDSIVRLARKIGTYEPSLPPYKDCCSLLAKKPKTKASTSLVRRLETDLNVAALVTDSLRSTEVWDGTFLKPWTPHLTKNDGEAVISPSLEKQPA